MSSLGSPNPFFIAGKKAYEVERSLRFNDNDSAELERTPSSASNRKTFTFSFWVKRANLGIYSTIFGMQYSGSANQFVIRFDNTDKLSVFDYQSSSMQMYLLSNALFRDVSAWYHIVVAVDTTQSTASNRGRIYINNNELTSFSTETNPSQNHDTIINTTNTHYIGQKNSGSYFDGYLAEFNFIDGFQYDPSYFGETNALTGQWNPKKYVGSYGTNGFYLNFSDNSGTTATTLGKDSSGNGNNFTPNNFSVAAGAGNDSLEDTPTNNFCTINPLAAGRLNIFPDASNGNLDFNISSSFKNPASSFQIPASGKWYAEYVFTTVGSGVVNVGNLEKAQGSSAAEKLNGISLLGGEIRVNDSSTQTSLTAFSANDIIGVKVDRDAGTVAFTINGSAVGNAENISSMNAPTDLVFRAYRNSSGGSAPVGSVNFGQRPFSYLPTGYKSLCSANLPDPTIKLPNKNFDILTYTGTDSAANRTLTGLNFSPDWVWQKRRNGTNWHGLHDSVRGGGKSLYSNSTNAEATNNQYGYLSEFTSDGFTWSAGSTNNSDGNETGGTFVSWCWNGGDTDGKTYTVTVVSDSGNKYRFDGYGTSAVTLDLAEGGTYIFNYPSAHPFRFSTTSDGTHGGGSEYTTGVTVLSSTSIQIVVAASAPTLYYYCTQHSGMGGQVNTNSTLGSSNFDGSLQATVKANTTAGFSIGLFTGTGSNASIGHGLGVAPSVVIAKSRSHSDNWFVYHKSLGANAYIMLNSTNAADTNNSTVWQNVSPTSSVFYASTGGYNDSGQNLVFYAFSEVAGYSKFGSYVGNGSADGTFVFTGFRPAWVLIKCSSNAENWYIIDNKRPEYNGALGSSGIMKWLRASTNDSESQNGLYNFLSNGFKLGYPGADTNASGRTYIYLAFAESPFKNARAR